MPVEFIVGFLVGVSLGVVLGLAFAAMCFGVVAKIVIMAATYRQGNGPNGQKPLTGP